MIQKKVCMVGVSGAGKTSLVMQFVHSKFSTKYHSTVGVKIDRKTVELNGESITLVLWDVAGKDPTHEIPASYLRGSHGIILVVDGTRRDTWEQLAAVLATIESEYPAVVEVARLDEWFRHTGADLDPTVRDDGLHFTDTGALRVMDEFLGPVLLRLSAV